MTNFYDIIDKIKQIAEGTNFTNKISFGDISDVDLDKKTNFPLIHIVIEEAVITQRTIDFNVRLIAADLVDYYKDGVNYDKSFFGNSNMQDILNSQLWVLTRLVTNLKAGGSRDSGFTIEEEETTMTPFLDRFENELAGWEADIYIKTPNTANTSSNCD